MPSTYYAHAEVLLNQNEQRGSQSVPKLSTNHFLSASNTRCSFFSACVAIIESLRVKVGSVVHEHKLAGPVCLLPNEVEWGKESLSLCAGARLECHIANRSVCTVSSRSAVEERAGVAIRGMLLALRAL